MKKRTIFVGALLVASSHIFAQQEAVIPEVTIAAKTPQPLYETGKPVTLLTRQDLEKFRGQSLGTVLDQLPGVQISGNFNNDTELKSMKIRGGTAANVVILLDGVPLKDATATTYTAADLRLLSAENVESIEVMNGASSVLYGSNATVSVINIHMRKEAQKAVEGQISARGGSFNTFAQDAAVRGNIHGFTYQVAALNEKSDGISSALGDSSFDKDGFEKQNFSGSVGYSANQFSISLNGGHNHNLFKYDNAAFSDGRERGDDAYNHGGLHAGYTYNKGEIVLNARLAENSRLGTSLVSGGYKDQFSYTGHTFFAELYNRYRFSDYVNVVAGIQYGKDGLGTQSLPYGGTAMQNHLLSGDTTLTNLDAYLNFNLKYEGFHLDTGGRMTDSSKYGTHWVYSANPYYLQDLGSRYLKGGFSFATAFIAPTLYQDYGSLPYTLPNPDLKPETNESTEVDLEFGRKDGSLKITASLFRRNEAQGFFYQSVDPQAYISQYQNIAHNRVKGFEAGAYYKPDKALAFGGNFSYVEKDQEAAMLRQPKQRANAFVDISPCTATHLNISYLYVAKRTDSYYDSTTYSVKDVTDASYSLFNLNLSQTIFQNFEMFGNVGNLFNKSYVDVVGYTTKPRNYTVGFTYKF